MAYRKTGLVPCGSSLPHPSVFVLRGARTLREISKDTVLSIGRGIDLNYVLPGENSRSIPSAHDPKSGRRLAVSTDMPGIQVFSGGNLTDEIFEKSGTPYAQHGGVSHDHTTTYQFLASRDDYEI